MSHMPLRTMPIFRTVAGAVIVFVTVLIANPAVGAGKDETPQLSIAIDNGKTSAKAGDTLTYRTVVKNLGPDGVAKLRIKQSLPPGLTATAADSSGVISKAEVAWVINLKAAGSMTLTTSATVSKTSAQTLRLASVACASVGTTSPPIVCASHSDQLAAGARAEAAAAAASSDDTSAWWRNPWVAAAVGVAAIGGAVFLRLRRRRAPTGPGPHRA